MMREIQDAVPTTVEVSVLVAGVVAGVVVVLVLALVAISRRRRRQRARSVEGIPLVDAGEGEVLEDAADVRVLHAQIRLLEEALEQESALAREPAPTETTTVGDEAAEELHRRIRATLQGLSGRMQDDPTAVHVLARVEAAMDRLIAPAERFARPALTLAPQVAPLPTEHAPRRLEAFGAALGGTVPEVAAPTAPGVEASTPPVPSAVAPAPLAPEDEVVLPVPARPSSTEVRRGRRWRRSAA